jgi:threonylcarbamoyladenosine tRNA methylthiotransferase MtaB
VLARMRRRYRVGRFLNTLDLIRRRLPDVAFTTDLIVGFPGETAAEFEESLETCRRAGFSRIHAFPFSARRETPAATYPDQVPPDVRKLRLERLAAVEADLARRYHQRWIDRPLQLLVERCCSERPGFVGGTDRHYMPVVAPGAPSDLGQFVSVRGRSANGHVIEAER